MLDTKKLLRDNADAYERAHRGRMKRIENAIKEMAACGEGRGVLGFESYETYKEVSRAANEVLGPSDCKDQPVNWSMGRFSGTNTCYILLIIDPTKMKESEE